MQKTNNLNINTRTYWDSVYGTPEKRQGYANTGTDLAVPGAQQTKRFKETLKYIKDGDRVLDIGCGVGVFTKLAKATYPNCEVWGTDISSRVIADDMAESPEIIYHHQYIGRQDKVPSDYFDVVFCGETIEHLDDPAVLFQDAARVLRRDGQLIITTPLQESFQSPEHVFFFDYEDVEQLYQTNGFSFKWFVYLPDMEHLYVIYAIGRKL